MQAITGLLTFLTLISVSLTGHAEVPEITRPVLTCGAANGAMAHSLHEAENHMLAVVSFPTYIDVQSSKRLLNIPLSSSGLNSDNLAFLKDKNEAFTKLFANAKNNELSKNLRVKFQKDSCVDYKNNDHSVYYCEDTVPQKIGDLEIDRIEMSIESQDRLNVNGLTKIYIAYLVIQTSNVESGKPVLYSTAYTYYVDEGDINCTSYEPKSS